ASGAHRGLGGAEPGFAEPRPRHHPRNLLPGRSLDRQRGARERSAHPSDSAEHRTQSALRRQQRCLARLARRGERGLDLMTRKPWGRSAVIAAPYLWLGLFALLPLAIVLKISMAESVLGIPPYGSLVDMSAGTPEWVGTLENYQ